MSPEFDRPPQNNLEVRLFSRVNEITNWVERRNQNGSHDGATQRKLVRKMAALTQEFRDVAAYIQTPLVIMPMDNGMEGIGIGETTGEIAGFLYREYPTINQQMKQGPTREGIVAIIATGGTNIEGVTPASWNQIIPEEARAVMSKSDDYTEKGVVPVLVPIVEGTHFAQIDNSVPLHFNPSHLLAAEVANNPNQDYREYVTRIENLMKGKYTVSAELDKPIMAALHKELNAMNSNCPLLGQSVEVSAAYMLTPNLITPGGFTVLSGEVQGVLRKFVYGAYFPGSSQPHLKPRGTVQAVVYRPDVAKMVYSGELPPQEADKLTSTVFIPLDQEHTLTSIS